MDNKDPETLVQSKETWECHGQCHKQIGGLTFFLN